MVAKIKENLVSLPWNVRIYICNPFRVKIIKDDAGLHAFTFLT